MLRATLTALRQRGDKYPRLVSYNKVKWEMLAPDSPRLHESVSAHYAQTLRLAATADIPHLLQDFHLDIPSEKHHALLPSTIYVVPGIAAELAADPSSFAPYGWQGTVVRDPVTLQHYGPVQAAVAGTGAAVTQVITYKSPDLRLLCNAVVFTVSENKAKGPPTTSFAPASSFGKMADAASTSTKQSDIEDTAAPPAALPDFVLFHYFRPNRPVGELVRPLEKYFRHPLAFSNSTTNSRRSNSGNSNTSGGLRTSWEDVFTSAGSWEPQLEASAAAKKTKLTPAVPFVAPTSHLPGLYERLALQPGGSFGRRSLMWGTYF